MISDEDHQSFSSLFDFGFCALLFGVGWGVGPNQGEHTGCGMTALDLPLEKSTYGSGDD
jgi:hypothetical protein